MGWPSVEMMLNNLTMAEYVNWVAYFSVNWDEYKPDQTPEQLQANLALSLAGIKRNAT